MPKKYDNPDNRRDLIVMVRFKKGVKQVLDQAVAKSGEKTLSAFVRRATWEWAKQITEAKD